MCSDKIAMAADLAAGSSGWNLAVDQTGKGRGCWLKNGHGFWTHVLGTGNKVGSHQSYQHGSGASGRSTGTLQEVVVKQGDTHNAEYAEKVKSGTMVGLKEKDCKEGFGRTKGKMVAQFGEASTMVGLHLNRTMVGSHEGSGREGVMVESGDRNSVGKVVGSIMVGLRNGETMVDLALQRTMVGVHPTSTMVGQCINAEMKRDDEDDKMIAMIGAEHQEAHAAVNTEVGGSEVAESGAEDGIKEEMRLEIDDLKSMFQNSMARMDGLSNSGSVARHVEERGGDRVKECDRTGKAILDEKHFRNMEKFDGSEEGWGNWFFKLMTQIAGASTDAAEVVEKVMADKEGANWNRVKALAGEGMRFDGVVFRVVAGLTTGDASTVVRSAAMGEAGKSGLWALKQLQKRCNPRTIGRRLKALMGVVAPSQVKLMGEVVRKVEEWELAVKKVEAEYGECIPGSMQVAVLISMLPKELQDIAFQLSKDGEELDYKEVRGRVPRHQGQGGQSIRIGVFGDVTLHML